jgi:hypothetical protein
MNSITDEGTIRRGRPYNSLIRDRILRILEELPIATPQRIKERYEANFKVPISWNTVANRLTELKDEGKVFVTATTPKANIRGTTRTRIHKVYSLKPLR